MASLLSTAINATKSEISKALEQFKVTETVKYSYILYDCIIVYVCFQSSIVNNLRFKININGFCCYFDYFMRIGL